MTATGVNTSSSAADQASASPTSLVPPASSDRTPFTIAVSGWYFENGCSHPGIEVAGTYALEMNANTNAISDIPCAACAFGAYRPITMNTTVKTTAYTTHRPRAARAPPALPVSRKPNANPSAVVVAMDHTFVTESASVRPSTSDSRGTGSESSRSVNPAALSSATATAIPP